MSTDGLTYEQIVEKLEAVTAELAGGTAGIEAATELFEQAQQLHAAASARLEWDPLESTCRHASLSIL